MRLPDLRAKPVQPGASVLELRGRRSLSVATSGSPWDPLLHCNSLSTSPPGAPSTDHAPHPHHRSRNSRQLRAHARPAASRARACAPRSPAYFKGACVNWFSTLSPAPPPGPNSSPPGSSRVTTSPAMQRQGNPCHTIMIFDVPWVQSPSKMGKRAHRGACQRNTVHQRASEALLLSLGHVSFSLSLNAKNVDHDSPRTD